MPRLPRSLNTLSLLTAGAAFLASSSAIAGESPERRLQGVEAPALGLVADPGGEEGVVGSYELHSGHELSLTSEVVSDHHLEVTVRAEDLAVFVDVDFETGQLTIDGNREALTQADHEALWQAYRDVGEMPGGNHAARVFLYRAVGLLLEAPGDFDWSHYEVPLPVLHPDTPSYLEAISPPTKTPRVERLSRWDSAVPWDGDVPESLGLDVMASPGPEGGSFGSCGSYLTDRADGNIRCVEHGNYYCVEYDYMRNAISKKTMKQSIPAIPPWVSRTVARTIETSTGERGTYPCSGRCGPGCDPNPGWLGGHNAWGLGCLIHDQCVYEAYDAKPKANDFNNTANKHCGDEMAKAFDDFFMPLSFCPGDDTVGGSGRWRRQIADPRKRPNTVSSARTPVHKKIVGLPPKPSSGGGSTSGGGGPPRPPKPGKKGGMQ